MVQFYHKLTKNLPSIWLGTFWSNWWVLFERTRSVRSKSTHWVIWWVLLKQTQGFRSKVPTGYFDGYFLKELTTYPLGNDWANCFKTHNELTMYPLGKWPLAPSMKRWGVVGLLGCWLWLGVQRADEDHRLKRSSWYLILRPHFAPSSDSHDPYSVLYWWPTFPRSLSCLYWYWLMTHWLTHRHMI